MLDYKHATADDLIEDARKNNHLKELKKMAKPGTSYIQVKRSYFEEYYPEALPRAKKKQSFWDKIQEA